MSTKHQPSSQIDRAISAPVDCPLLRLLDLRLLLAFVQLNSLARQLQLPAISRHLRGSISELERSSMTSSSIELTRLYNDSWQICNNACHSRGLSEQERASTAVPKEKTR